MTPIEIEIQKMKKDLLEKYNISSDRDLVKQLGIKEEDKDKLYSWIKYQQAYSYKSGCNDGREELKHQISELIKPHQY